MGGSVAGTVADVDVVERIVEVDADGLVVIMAEVDDDDGAEAVSFVDETVVTVGIAVVVVESCEVIAVVNKRVDVAVVDDIDIDDDGKLNSQTMLYDFICIFCAYGECDCREQEH